MKRKTTLGIGGHVSPAERVRPDRYEAWLSAAVVLAAATASGCGSSGAAEIAQSHGPAPAEPTASIESSLTGEASWIAAQSGAGTFPLASAGKVAPIVVAAEDFPGVLRVAGHFQADVKRVTAVDPVLSKTGAPPAGAKEVVLIGTLGKSPLVDGLVEAGKLDVSAVSGKWETFLIQSVEAPMAGVDRALVVAGSDKRGTIYGVYELSAQIGVSPWYWWADVPPRQGQELHVLAGAHTLGEPKVKYRGFFINDENPALLGWYNATFTPANGRFGSGFYERVFELLMRMKGNYLWPAMWGKAFNADDAQNPALADEYGVVMGTSHHEPMTRAQQEWTEGGTGAWDYASNAATLRTFWEGGIRRMGTRETLVTLGMRGDGDEAGTANRMQLEGIITDQRAILASVTGRRVESIPQVWTLYKEVQDYYDQGMRVPDDVTLLFADDNWGNIRKLPKPDATPRAGGYGVYYHYDYVGGPRNYKWINTNQISRVWEQMHLAYQHEATQIWIVNVGDIKPMEFPTQFFLDYAWNPEKWPAERLPEYTRQWAEQQFGADHSAAIGDVLTKYTRFNARRKPELLAINTYSHVNYQEAETVVAEYNAIAKQAEDINAALPMNARDAFYQLVLYPVQACANLNELYVTAGKNQLYATQGRASTNALAARARELFARDSQLSKKYNEEIAGGKWAHMMDQTHIGYTDWQEPAMQTMPAVREISPPAAAQMAIAIDGSEATWPGGQGMPALPEITPFHEKALPYIDVFNKGTTAFTFTATASVPWLTITPAMGSVMTEQRLAINVDWPQAPAGAMQVPITIAGPSGASVTVQAVVNKPETPSPEDWKGFVQRDSYVSMEAEHYTAAVNTDAVRWLRVPDLGRTLGAMTPEPSTAPAQMPGGQSPHLQYQMHLFEGGQLTVRAYVAPTLNYQGAALRYAVSFDDAAPKTVSIHPDTSQQTWEKWVSDNINVSTSTHTIAQPGTHVLKFWMVDPGVVLQKLVVEIGGAAKPSYLGPPADVPLGLPPPMAGTGGGAGGPPGTAGVPGTTGGVPGTTGGAASTAGGANPGSGTSGAAPVGTGGAAGAAGNAPGIGGALGAGAQVGAGTMGTPVAGGGGAPGGDDGGCGCGVPAKSNATAWGFAAMAAAAAFSRRGRQRSAVGRA